MKIFVNGSRKVDKNIPKTICDKIDKYLRHGDEFILIGNAGIDMSVQKHLFAQEYDKVTIYFSGDREHKIQVLH